MRKKHQQGAGESKDIAEPAHISVAVSGMPLGVVPQPEVAQETVMAPIARPEKPILELGLKINQSAKLCQILVQAATTSFQVSLCG